MVFTAAARNDNKAKMQTCSLIALKYSSLKILLYHNITNRCSLMQLFIATESLKHHPINQSAGCGLLQQSSETTCAVHVNFQVLSAKRPRGKGARVTGKHKMKNILHIIGPNAIS